MFVFIVKTFLVVQCNVMLGNILMVKLKTHLYNGDGFSAQSCKNPIFVNKLFEYLHQGFFLDTKTLISLLAV